MHSEDSMDHNSNNGNSKETFSKSKFFFNLLYTNANTQWETSNILNDSSKEQNPRKRPNSSKKSNLRKKPNTRKKPNSRKTKEQPVILPVQSAFGIASNNTTLSNNNGKPCITPSNILNTSVNSEVQNIPLYSLPLSNLNNKFNNVANINIDPSLNLLSSYISENLDIQNKKQVSKEQTVPLPIQSAFGIASDNTTLSNDNGIPCITPSNILNTSVNSEVQRTPLYSLPLSNLCNKFNNVANLNIDPSLNLLSSYISENLDIQNKKQVSKEQTVPLPIQSAFGIASNNTTLSNGNGIPCITPNNILNTSVNSEVPLYSLPFSNLHNKFNNVANLNIYPQHRILNETPNLSSYSYLSLKNNSNSKDDSLNLRENNFSSTNDPVISATKLHFKLSNISPYLKLNNNSNSNKILDPSLNLPSSYISEILDIQNKKPVYPSINTGVQFKDTINGNEESLLQQIPLFNSANSNTQPASAIANTQLASADSNTHVQFKDTNQGNLESLLQCNSLLDSVGSNTQLASASSNTQNEEPIQLSENLDIQNERLSENQFGEINLLENVFQENLENIFQENLENIFQENLENIFQENLENVFQENEQHIKDFLNANNN